VDRPRGLGTAGGELRQALDLLLADLRDGAENVEARAPGRLWRRQSLPVGDAPLDVDRRLVERLDVEPELREAQRLRVR
jgi:hypothetical protein